MYTIQQLKDDVLTEANKIKQFATVEERSMLNFETLNPIKRQHCIYGQMTGDCDSVRAIELIEKCAARFVADSSLTYIRSEGFKRIQEKINGTRVNNLQDKRSSVWGPHIAHSSMIEAYILLRDANNEGLIEYIKGESDTVEL